MRLLVLLILLITPRIALAASKVDLSGIAYEQKLYVLAIPLQQMFRDENGAAARLTPCRRGKTICSRAWIFSLPEPLRHRSR